MEIVLRPVSDRFFQEAVMPFLTRAMGDAPGALEWLQGQLGDEQTRFMCERLLSTAMPGGAGGLEPEPWTDLVERLIFIPWREGAAGWEIQSPRAGFAGDWDEALHLALMMEQPDYPYANPREARAVRDGFRLKPRGDQGLVSLIAGAWEPVPEFPPDQIFSTQGRGGYVPREGVAFADWAWRPGRAVVNWHLNLQRKLERLITREQERLKLASLPERDELLAYWMGKAPHPPPLAVAFSGLGPRAPSWLLELGVIAGHVREAALEHSALVSLVTKGVEVQV
jgi:hypothetical protein